MSFSDFNLAPPIMTSLTEIGYQKPTPIQALAIPKILSGLDLIASAQTGTGKTAAFMLPALHQLTTLPKTKGKGPQILVLVPTRELAIQVATEAKKFGKHLPHLKTVCVYGGVPYPPQIKSLHQPYDILVATPGRLIDHMDEGRINLSRVKFLVLDEADRMLDMGFIAPVEKIAAATPKDRQTLLFSATLDQKILKISKKMQNQPFEIKIEPDHTVKGNIEQRFYFADGMGHKLRLLDHILANTPIDQAIIFTSTKRQANEIALQLHEKGHRSGALHGNMNQRQRTRTIDRLRRGQIQILVATDVAARGIDVASLSHVINLDLPYQEEDYVHRIGRTGRAGASGVAITFASYAEESMITKISKMTGSSINIHTIEGLEPKPKADRKFGRSQKPNGSSFDNDRRGGRRFPSKGKFKPFGKGRSGGSKARFGGKSR
ncbi:MAG: DEAD/DEAH box helicase [Verrucomicrobia bacterium]|nr:DEAD/DEAH box helicase [Verrucomicrobiota bacterium]